MFTTPAGPEWRHSGPAAFYVSAAQNGVQVVPPGRATVLKMRTEGKFP